MSPVNINRYKRCVYYDVTLNRHYFQILFASLFHLYIFVPRRMQTTIIKWVIDKETLE